MEKQFSLPKRRLKFKPKHLRRDSCRYHRCSSKHHQFIQHQRLVLAGVPVPHPSLGLSELYESEEEGYYGPEDCEIAIPRTHSFHERELIAECPSLSRREASAVSFHPRG